MRCNRTGGREMAERLGLGLIPGAGWRASDITAVAREAEDAGFDSIFAAEVNNDALATTLLMGEATGGRMILGLGTSHRPVNSALNVEMPSAVAALRRYATEVAGWLRGEGPT